jgi:hypothetical protein
MTLSSFLNLNDTQKVKLLLAKGVHLCERREGVYRVSLYQLDGFYIEVHYHQQQKHIACVNAFSCLEPLEPYLPFIDISKLLFTKG